MLIKSKFTVLLSIFISALLLFSSCGNSSAVYLNYDSNKLAVHYIDVGQGDSILIQLHGKNMLIDAGPTDSRNKLIKYLKKLKISKLDYVVETHPHEDHIGGMSKVLSTFTIGSFYAPRVTTQTKSFEDMVRALDKKNLKIHVVKPGMSFDFGGKANCTVLAPNSEKYTDLNNYSTVIKFNYGNNKFLFTGDAQKLSEDEMIKKDYDLSCDVLKVGHHGSRSSTSDEFLKLVTPKIAVISCGKGNDYGHPHKPTLDKLKNINVIIYRTDIDGTITLVSDGNKITKE